ncbi:hypothetical protein PV328_010449 [Microctonus aethiopoides]|uniref:Ataxin-10 n=2 Tax=Microctonus aethiopoides TaxID=144406 RepID=A0AA39KQ71_9HYME|nr:hypothetical protein PV328_010449 [Microctonus aethiopoides]
MEENNLPADLLDRLCYIERNGDWNELTNNLQPKTFLKNESNHAGRKVVAKLAEMLMKPGLIIPNNVTIIIMKCLTNACVPSHDVENNHNYLHKAIDMTKLNPNLKLNWNKIYMVLSMQNINELEDKLLMECLMEYPETRFPYDGVVQWIINELNIITNSSNITTEQWDIMRISFSFLCNISAVVDQDLPDNIYDPQLKKIIIKLLSLDFDTPEKITLTRRICCFIYNIMKITNLCYIPEDFVIFVYGLLKADQLGINIAQDILLLLMNTPQFVRDIYEILPTELKLYMLEVLYQNLKSTVYDCANNENVYIPSNDIIKFLADRFKKKSDLILKTVNTYVNGMEPVEITIILDILGVLTTTKLAHHITLQNDTSLLINTVYLLKALHMAGKEADNCFTPVQKLSEIAPSTSHSTKNAKTDENIQNHPGFGFKAALIRLIGNLVFRNKKNQDTVKDLDGIPLLLDCSNIDARNPLIIQWTILAIRNLCEGNIVIQQLIDSSQKIKHIDNEIVREFGIKLNENEDGSAIGIVSLPKTHSG